MCGQSPFGTQANNNTNLTPNTLVLVAAIDLIGVQVDFSVTRIFYKLLQLNLRGSEQELPKLQSIKLFNTTLVPFVAHNNLTATFGNCIREIHGE